MVILGTIKYTLEKINWTFQHPQMLSYHWKKWVVGQMMQYLYGQLVFHSQPLSSAAGKENKCLRSYASSEKNILPELHNLKLCKGKTDSDIITLEWQSKENVCLQSTMHSTGMYSFIFTCIFPYHVLNENRMLLLMLAIF